MGKRPPSKTDVDALVQEYLDDPKTIGNRTQLQKRIKKEHPDLTLRQITEALARDPTPQLVAAPAPKQVSIPWVSPPGTWQMDLAFVDDHPILTAINVNTRFAFAKRLPNKRSENVNAALEDFLEAMKGRRVEKIQTDLGSEFINRDFGKILEKHGIGLQFLTDSKAYVVERFHRTLRELIHMYKEQTKSFKKWMPVLDDLLENYNRKPMRVLRKRLRSPKDKSPENMTEDDEDEMYWRTLGEAIMKASQQQKLEPGDVVRMRVKKATFDKTGRRWSKKTYVVEKRSGWGVRLDNGDYARRKDLLKVGEADDDESDNDVEQERREHVRTKKRTHLLRREGIEEENILPTRTRQRR